jgi:hypothetical protein
MVMDGSRDWLFLGQIRTVFPAKWPACQAGQEAFQMRAGIRMFSGFPEFDRQRLKAAFSGDSCYYMISNILWTADALFQGTQG